MKRIIEFLSGEMSEPDKERLEQEIRGNPEFEEEFHRVKSAWEIIKNQLREERGASGQVSSEDIKAGIMAEFDIESYGTVPTSRREKMFARSLERSMSKQKEFRRESRNIRLLTVVTLATAAAFAAIILLVYPEKDFNYLLMSYYDDRAALVSDDIHYATRSDPGSGVLFFREGDYAKARQSFEREMQKVKNDSSLMIIYSILLVETGDKVRGLELLSQLSEGYNSRASLDAAWQMALQCFLLENDQQAITILERIIEANSYHASGARKLLFSYEKEHGERGTVTD